MYCRNCGAFIDDSASVCANCGAQTGAFRDNADFRQEYEQNVYQQPVQPNGYYPVYNTAVNGKKSFSPGVILGIMLINGMIAVFSLLLPFLPIIGDYYNSYNIIQFIVYAGKSPDSGGAALAIVGALFLILPAAFEIVYAILSFMRRKAAGGFGLAANILMLFGALIWAAMLFGAAYAVGMHFNGGYITSVPVIMVCLPVAGIVFSSIAIAKRHQLK